MLSLLQKYWYAAAGLAGLLLWRARASAPALPPSPFTMLNQVRYWRPDLMRNIASILGRYDVGPHLAQDGTPSGVERIFTLFPKGKGQLGPALAFVRAEQAKGAVVTSTTNLLDTSSTAGPKGIAVLLPAEFPKKAENAEGVAVLPKLA